MAADISVGIGVLGEKEFKRALDECQNSLKQLDAGLKANAAEFGKNEDAMRSSYERNELLKKSLEENVKINDALGEAIDFASRQYGAASKQATQYATAQARARENIARLSRELEQSDQNMLELGRDSGRVGRQLEQGIGEAADDVSRKFDSMVNKLDQDLGEIRKSVDISAFADLGGMIGGAIGSAYEGITGIVEGSIDYRRRMSFLDENALAAGLDPNKLRAMAAAVSILSGDMDAAIEGMSNLAAAGLELDEVEKTVERLSGAIIRFPDTYKFETLAEDLRMSIGERQFTGQLAEMLTTLGVDLEKANKALEEAGKKGQEAVETAALSMLSEHGLEEQYESWRKHNEELAKYLEAQAKLTDSQAALAETMTPAATAGIEMMTGFIDKLVEAIEFAEAKVKEFETDDPAKKWLNEKAEELTGVDQDEALAFYKERGQKSVDEWFEGANTSLDTNSPIMEGNMLTAAENAAKQYVQGIKNQTPQVASAAAAMYQAAVDAVNKTIPAPKVGTGATNYGGQSYPGNAGSEYGAAVINLDGKNVGEGMVEYNSDATGKKIDRATTYLY